MTDARRRRPPIRLTDLTDCGGCAAKLGADLLADALRGLGADAAARARRGAHRRPGPARRRRRLPGQRRPGDHRHARLLSAARRRPAHVRRDRRGERAVATCSRWAAGCCSPCRSRHSPRTCRGTSWPRSSRAPRARSARRAARSPAATRSATRSPSTGWRSSAPAHPDRLLRKGGAQPGDALILTKRLGTGVLVSGHRQGRTSGGGPRRARSTRCARSTAPPPRCSSRRACGPRPT